MNKVYSLDEYRFGMNALWWYNKTGEEKYKTAADGIRGMLDRHPRTPSGGVSIFRIFSLSFSWLITGKVLAPCPHL